MAGSILACVCVAVPLQCMFAEGKLLQARLEQDDRQLAVFHEQLQRLEGSLEKGAKLVAKWGEPIGRWQIKVAVRFFTTGMDKEDIKDVSRKPESYRGKTWVAWLHSCSSVGLHLL